MAILKDKEELNLGISGPFEIIDLKTNKILFSGKDLVLSMVSAQEKGVRIKNTLYSTDSLLISPKKDISITVNKRKYRGDISIFKDSSLNLMVVNKLDLEYYIKGVLLHEISPKWPMDAIKAQAVAVRTYAMYQKEVMRSKHYDVMADTSSQVYGGYFSEMTKTNLGVSLTEGEVLLYKNKLFPAYFHATCAGTTENASELSKINLEPLRGGRQCGFCATSPHYSWKAEMSLQDIREKLAGRCAFEGELADISVVERNPSGRARTIELKDDFNETCDISAKDFRFLMGPDIFRSTNFTITVEADKVIFSGKGWGHGVGLCQWGALGMAKQGFSYKEILEFYYPGAKIIKLS
ncbi:MAG TPA: SpoIID/LytB domain-containing protein [Candidatus Omnitrophota bacterium]|nr:SpoIID/LytB domain-containing protein [Candidatus Omnitrophota bacterium]